MCLWSLGPFCESICPVLFPVENQVAFSTQLFKPGEKRPGETKNPFSLPPPKKNQMGSCHAREWPEKAARYDDSEILWPRKLIFPLSTFGLKSTNKGDIGFPHLRSTGPQHDGL